MHANLQILYISFSNWDVFQESSSINMLEMFAVPISLKTRLKVAVGLLFILITKLNSLISDSQS